MIKDPKPPQWLEELRVNLPSDIPGSVIITTKEGVRYITLDRTSIDQYQQQQHQRFLRILYALMAAFIIIIFTYAWYEWKTSRLETHLDQRGLELTEIHSTLEQILNSVPETLATGPDSQPADQLGNIRALVGLLMVKDQALRFYIESTREVMKQEVEAMATALASAGFNQDQAMSRLHDSIPMGGALMNSAISDIIDIYVNDDLQTLLETYEQQQSFQDAMPKVRPLRNSLLTSRFGIRRHPISGRTQAHMGVDFVTYSNQEIRASGAGMVTFAGTNGGFGKMVIIDHGLGLETLYGHLDKVYVAAGEEIDASMAIGKMGNTGESTAPHLHYEVRFMGRQLDPLRIFKVTENVR